MTEFEGRLNQLIADSRMTRTQVTDFIDLLNGIETARVGRGRLSGVMTTWLTSAMASVAAVENVRTYGAKLDPLDPDLGTPSDTKVTYVFAAMEDPTQSETACQVQPGVLVSGYRQSVRLTAQGSAQVSTEVVSADDLVFQNVCDGLGLPLSSIMTSTPRGELSNDLDRKSVV